MISVYTFISAEDQPENHIQKQQRRHEAKHPELQRYQPAAGQGRRHRDKEKKEANQRGCQADLSTEHDKASHSEKKDVPESDAGGGDILNKTEDDRMSTDRSTPQNSRKDHESNSEERDGNGSVEKDEHQGCSGAANKSKKTRKPDREFYQPGSRRSIQGKDCKVERKQERHPPSKSDEKPGEPEKLSGCDEKNERPSRHQNINNCVEEVTSKVGNIRLKEVQGAGVESFRRGESTDKESVVIKDGKETAENKSTQGNHRKRSGKDKEKMNEFKQDDAGNGGKNTPMKAERERDTRAAKGIRNKSEKTGEPNQSRRRESQSDNRKGVNNNNSKSLEAEKHTRTDGRDRNRSKDTIPALMSKRYSKSDIRHSRNRNYSSSSESSLASLDEPRREMVPEKTNFPRPRTEHKIKEGIINNEGGRRSHLKSWTTNEESSTEDGSEMSDRTESRRRKKKGAKDDFERDRNRAKGNRGVGRGILRISLEKQLDGSSHNSDMLSKSPVPRGRGGGVLVLPTHKEISTSPEVGKRLLFGGIRGGVASRSRGGRGGVRRLWDPNNPDQKPALTQGSQNVPLQQPVYHQTGPGYGQLHFLDTDDEVAGSPPVPQGEHFRSQQVAAMAYYKFQTSDNPYCYPMAPSNPHSPTTSSQRYPYPYHPYQVAHPNGLYQSPGVSQLCGSNRGGGYHQPGVISGLTLEEVEQQSRGELGRMLRAADTQELQISNLLSRDRVSADGLDRMTRLRSDLLGLYEQVILTDIEFSDSQNVDQALWKNVFYQVIERFRQLLKDTTYENTPHIRNLLLTLLDEGALFFDNLLQKLQTVYQFKLEDYMDGIAIRARPLRKTILKLSTIKCDLARYREQASDSANYGKARSWYLKAQQIAPKNGRPYNQLALLAVYTKRKLDAVYYYMRSLAASNPILTAKESLMSLFEEAKRKTEQLEQRRKQEHEDTRGPAVRGRRRSEEGARVEIWIHPSGQSASKRGCSESSRDSEQDGELGSLSVTDLNKKFILSFLHAHGKLFTNVGMDSFTGVASCVLQEFRTLLQHGPSLLGSTHLLQIITINMFAIHNVRSKGEGEVRSVLQEQRTTLGLGMFALLVQCCTKLLKDIPTEPVPMADGEKDVKAEELEGVIKVSAFPLDLREVLPSIKVWSDWMLGHQNQWNPPPCSLESSPNVWQCLADLCNALARVDHQEVPLYKIDTEEGEGDEELTILQLKEDRLLAGFVPLLASPHEPCYTDGHTDTAIAADCKRVTVLKYFLEALCGLEEPLLAFKGGKYISVASNPSADDVIVEAESSCSASESEEDAEEAQDGENEIRELRARRHALANKLAEQQKRKDKIRAMLQTSGQLVLEVRPLFLIPDTNGFIDHLGGLKKLLQCAKYIIVVPLIVITELDGLAKGQESFGGGNYNVSAAHVRAVQEKARLAVAFLERGFENREPYLRALTSRGNQLESIAFRSEDTSGQQGTNDDVILSCCLHYCKDKAKDFMPQQRNGTVKLQREVVLLTDDRNLRVKALTRNVPVRDIPAFLSWAKVG
uniref:Telomerase-binding protein EST1A n=1 Tax=Gouania willdenowi TaxID=441366 RepID=A0A8C5G1S8_GOUWI